jgi:GTP cyclohydrolase FolE2
MVPPEFMFIRAAQELGVSVFDLLSRPDRDYFVRAAFTNLAFTQWVNERGR